MGKEDVSVHHSVHFTAENYFSCWSWGGERRLGSYTGAEGQLPRIWIMEVLDNASHDRQSTCSIFVYHAYCPDKSSMQVFS